MSKRKDNYYTYDITLFRENSIIGEKGSNTEELPDRLLHALWNAFHCELCIQVSLTYYHQIATLSNFRTMDRSKQSIVCDVRLMTKTKINLKKLKGILPGFVVHTVSRTCYCNEDVTCLLKKVDRECSGYAFNDSRIYLATTDGKMGFSEEEENDLTFHYIM